MTMKTNEILQFVQDHDTFLITYYAKKHKKIITRKATWTKPNTDTQGKHFTSNWSMTSVLCILGFRRSTKRAMEIDGDKANKSIKSRK